MNFRFWLHVAMLLGSLCDVSRGDTVLLDFTAPWCQPCRDMQPVVDSLKAAGAPIKQVDYDSNEPLRATYRVTKIPHFVVVRDGAEVTHFTGKTNAATLRTMLKQGGWTPSQTVGKKANFAIVRADGFSADFVRDALAACEMQRHALAVEWFGEPLPDWPEPMQVTLKNTGAQLSGGGGATSFTFNDGTAEQFTATWQGNAKQLLEDVIPHEVCHAVMASKVTKQIARWADEGAASCVESKPSRHKLQAKAVELLKTERGLPTSQIVALTEYPKDAEAFYAQSHSQVAFLLEHAGKEIFASAVKQAETSGNWESVIRQFYELSTLSDFQASWLEWVRAGSPPAPEIYEVGFRGERCRCPHRWRPLEKLWERVAQRRSAPQAIKSLPKSDPPRALVLPKQPLVPVADDAQTARQAIEAERAKLAEELRQANEAAEAKRAELLRQSDEAAKDHAGLVGDYLTLSNDNKSLRDKLAKAEARAAELADQVTQSVRVEVPTPDSKPIDNVVTAVASKGFTAALTPIIGPAAAIAGPLAAAAFAWLWRRERCKLKSRIAGGGRVERPTSFPTDGQGDDFSAVTRDNTEAAQFVRLSRLEGRDPLHDAFVGRVAYDELDRAIESKPDSPEADFARKLRRTLEDRFNDMVPLSQTKGV